MLITLKFVLFISNSIKLEPTNPAPPVTTIIFLTFGIYLYYIIGKTNQSKVGLYQDALPKIELISPLILFKYISFFWALEKIL